MISPDALGPTVCIGEILVEIVATTRGDGFRQPQPLLGPFPSGAPAIFISQCGRMGGHAAMVGTVGADDFGTLNLECLRADGVDVSAVKVEADWPTGSAFVRYRQDGSRDFVYNIARSAAARLDWTDEVARVIAGAGHLHVMGSALSMPQARRMVLRAVGMVKGRGGSVSVDPNLRKELTQDAEAEAVFDHLIGLCDLLLPSGDELFRAAGTGAGDEDAAIAALRQRGLAEIAVKRGPAGASVHHTGGTAHAAGFVVEERDPTGAGDCFGGAYLTCRRLGMGIEEALDWACAAGARNVTALGPMEGAGTRDELQEFMRQTPRRG